MAKPEWSDGCGGTHAFCQWPRDGASDGFCVNCGELVSQNWGPWYWLDPALAGLDPEIWFFGVRQRYGALAMHLAGSVEDVGEVLG